MRTEIAYVLILLLVAAGVLAFAVLRARSREERAIRHGRSRQEARRRHRWWDRG
ncbi:hypothetical protein [Stakelama marina]|uniref:Uncharacterized protein n=1 Tax=Stakelama marina TaxID=2826939 RepID=A0A8T4IGM9_9SPHN|nr:hypothetical protein [Stakelama marina]MBR0553641.1 hypothetical protein [Stakelama marina]